MPAGENLFARNRRLWAGRNRDLIALMGGEHVVTVPKDALFSAVSELIDAGVGDRFELEMLGGQLQISRYATWSSSTPATKTIDCSGQMPGYSIGLWCDMQEFHLHEHAYCGESVDLIRYECGNALWIGRSHGRVITCWPSGSEPFGQISAGRTASQLSEYIKYLDDKKDELAGVPVAEMALRYERDRTLVSLIKELRGPGCQICGNTFKTKAGEFYSECHHLEGLAAGGLDVSGNILVLCAFHHTQFHHGQVAIKHHDAETLVVEIDGADYVCALGSSGALESSRVDGRSGVTP